MMQYLKRRHKEGYLLLTRAASNLVTRSDQFATLEASDISTFRHILDNRGVIIDHDDLKPFNRDWIGKYEGKSQLALRPRTVQHISEILKHCHSRRLALVPQSGNTGLVGGSVPVFDEIVLSMLSLDKVISFDATTGILVSEAGAVLQNLDETVSKQGYVLPLDLGAKGSCCIGGNVATNAGGLRLLRYGSLHGSVLGLEVVLADGTILDLLSTLRKDNTGYDLKQLFIGSEGTLGVITKVALLCAPFPQSINTAFLALSTFEGALGTLRLAKEMLGEILSAFEYLDETCMRITLQCLPSTRNPLPSTLAPFYVLVETRGSNRKHDTDKLEAFLEEAMASGLVLDGAVAQDSSQASSFWHIREGITEALIRYKHALYKYDVSLPTAMLATMVELTKKHIDENFRGDEVVVTGFGHLGDGNLHLNVSYTKYSDELATIIEPWIYEKTSEFNGSISAEHGLGLMKADCIGYCKSEVAIELMKSVKTTLDPLCILNPYKVLPP